ncbi:MAG: YihY/virulence factor BrkB family protein [Acidobacteria bacterium]|nr:YihY/virulence factor BrkB family protein [Acidobacteriota bacterium]
MASILPAEDGGASHPVPSRRARLFDTFRPTFHYLAETESHVYAFSIAANVLLSFMPFLIVLFSVFRHVFHWPAAQEAILLALRDYFPDPAMADFIRRNLVNDLTSRPFEWISMGLLLFTANGIFEPLEVALNRAWGVTKNRSYVRNQIVSLGLIFTTGGMALLSTVLTAINTEYFASLQGGKIPTVLAWVNVALFKMAAVPVSILILFLVYWVLPNRKINPMRIAPVAIIVGLLLEAMKYVNLLVWPWLAHKLSREVGPFRYSVSIILWSTMGAMIVLAGAEWSARHGRAQEE